MIAINDCTSDYVFRNEDCHADVFDDDFGCRLVCEGQEEHARSRIDEVHGSVRTSPSDIITLVLRKRDCFESAHRC
jgi:hypothetical protein